MRRTLLSLALIAAMVPASREARAQHFTEADFDDRGTGLILRPIEGIEPVDGRSRIIHRVQPAPQPPRARPAPPQPPPPRRATPTGKSLVGARGVKPPSKKPVTRMELAMILDRYLEYIQEEKAEIEKRIETIPIQKGLPPGMLEKLDRLVGDLTNLSGEELNMRRMVKDLSGQVHEQGVQLQKMKVNDMVTERRLERIEQTIGVRAGDPHRELTAEEAGEVDRLLARVGRLEDLLYQSLSQISENTTRIETPAQASASAAGDGDDWLEGRPQPRIPFASAGGISIGAERQAYRQRLLSRIRAKVESSQQVAAMPPEGESPRFARNPHPAHHFAPAPGPDPRLARRPAPPRAPMSPPPVPRQDARQSSEFVSDAWDELAAEAEEDFLDLVQDAKGW